MFKLCLVRSFKLQRFGCISSKRTGWVHTNSNQYVQSIFNFCYIILISNPLTSPGNFYFLRFSSADLQMAESRMFSVTSVAQRLYLQFTNGTFFIDKAIYPPPIVVIHDSDARVREQWQDIWANQTWMRRSLNEPTMSSFNWRLSMTAMGLLRWWYERLWKTWRNLIIGLGVVVNEFDHK